jgi:hypothetical protein
MDIISFSEQEFREHLFTMYWVIIIPAIFAFLQVAGIWPLAQLKKQGWVNTIERKILFYSLNIPFHIVAIIGGVSFVNMFTNSLVLVISSITISFVIFSCLIIGIALALYNHYRDVNTDGWKKIVEIDGGTQYYDHDGNVYTIMDMKSNPGFKDTKL